MFLEKLHTSSVHSVYEDSDVYLPGVYCAINQPKLGAGELQSVAPVDDHMHGVLVNITAVLWDSFLVISLASPSTEYHAA